MRIAACERRSFRAGQRMCGELVRWCAETGACVRSRAVREPGIGNGAKTLRPVPRALAARSSQSSRATAKPALRKPSTSPPTAVARRSGNRPRAIRPDCGLERPRSAKPRQIQSPLLMVWRPEQGWRDGRARTTKSLAAPASAVPSESPSVNSIGTSASVSAYPPPARYRAASTPSGGCTASLERRAAVKSKYGGLGGFSSCQCQECHPGMSGRGSSSGMTLV